MTLIKNGRIELRTPLGEGVIELTDNELVSLLSELKGIRNTDHIDCVAKPKPRKIKTVLTIQEVEQTFLAIQEVEHE